MSSTGRSAARKGHQFDYYVTPIADIALFLQSVTEYEPGIFAGGLILDPCAGGDATHPMSYPTALAEFGVDPAQIKTRDIRDDSPAEIKGDYLAADIGFQPKTIITNPPFVLAREFLEKALQDVAEDGFVIMLLRLNFFGSKIRLDLFQRHMPKYAFVHHKRISFTSDGKTDSIEYAHFIWQKGNHPTFTQLKVI